MARLLYFRLIVSSLMLKENNRVYYTVDPCDRSSVSSFPPLKDEVVLFNVTAFLFVTVLLRKIFNVRWTHRQRGDDGSEKPYALYSFLSNIKLLSFFLVIYTTTSSSFFSFYIIDSRLRIRAVKQRNEICRSLCCSCGNSEYYNRFIARRFSLHSLWSYIKKKLACVKF